MRKGFLRICLFLCVLLAVFANAKAAAFSVTNTGDSSAIGSGSLRRAIMDANNVNSDDTIEFMGGAFATPVTITLNDTGLTVENSGSLTINGLKTITVARNNVAGTPLFGIFRIQNTTIINNLTVTNGTFTSGIGFGGGIYVDGSASNLTLNNVTVRNNTSTTSGGGVYNAGGTLTVNNSSVINNTCGNGSGGGITNFGGTTTISRSTVSGNSSGGGGGGVSSAGDFGRLTIANSTISSNTTGRGGSGISAFSVQGINIITNSVVNGNTTSGTDLIGGSAIANTNSTSFELVNSTVSGNRVIGGLADNGGGVYSGANLTITNSTITDNEVSGSTSAGGVLSAAGGVTLTVRNTIIAGNRNNTTFPDVRVQNSGTFTSSGYNLIGNRGTVTNFNQTGDQTGTGASPLNPQLASLANNGGTTLTHALLANSPAINTGSNALALDENNQPLTTDQRGAGFPRINGNTVDIGAFESASAVVNRTKFDFDGDGKADVSVFRPANGVWYLLNSTYGFTAAQFGVSTDKIVPADYDGDGKTDLAVYRNGTWYLNRSTAGFTGISFGEATDIPQPADFDGDGKAELVVWRPSNGVWYVFNLVNNQFNAVQFGQNGDKPVASDYDGDGKADYAVYRSGIWYFLRSTLGFTGTQFGVATDSPVPADYDGDGKSDIAVFRPSNSTWYLQRSAAGFTGVQFGIASDLPTPADYDGDGKSDIAVFRDGTWYLNRTTQGFTGVQFGASDDRPIPNVFVP